MVIFNNSDQEKLFKSTHYSEGLKGATKGYEVITGKSISDLSALQIPAHSAMIVELK
jgi:hypothetical protein